MKIQYLAVIFILIILPITIVFSEYVNTEITLIETEALYDERLLNSTYDSIKAFQLNTINTTYYTPETRVKNIEAAVNTFYNSLVTAFKYDGNRKEVMKEYVPAVVFTMYDGYYIYSPFVNVLTNVSEEEADEDYKDNKIRDGLKPYVYYSCRYKNGSDYDFIINYTMDNYISIEGKVDGEYWSAKDNCGYLMNGQSLKEGISSTNGVKEKLKEYLLDSNGNKKEYSYILEDGTKYYLDNERIFYIDEQGEKHNQVIRQNNPDGYEQYRKRIEENSSAEEYYKESEEFTKKLMGKLKNLSTDWIDKGSANYAGYEFTDVGKIFDEENIQDADSNFNRHRADVIRAVITTNLSTAISGFGKYSNTGEEFIMPKISETDWELLENNICIATFMQGMRVGGKEYNGYSVVPNNFNKEYVDENDIYIIKNDNTYAKTNDATLNDSTIKQGLAGMSKINFERRVTADGKYYNPMSYEEDGQIKPYLASYTSISGMSGIIDISTSDMYKYMRGEVASDSLKKAYYTALGRERYGSYKFTK